MTSDWALATLGSVATFVNGDRGVNYPKGADYCDDGIPFISAVDIATGSLDLAAAKKVSRVAYERLRNGKIQRGDLLFCLRGSIGKCAMVRDEREGAIASSLVIIRGTSRASTQFLRYVLSTPVGQTLAQGLNNGSVQPNISVRDMKGIEFALPPRAYQDELADFVGKLDDRIDNLRATNATLEAIAQALFKSWFVDFDPVHAKAEGRAPAGMDAATAALFPSEFEDSELGPIPRGWQVCTVADIADVIRGRSYKSTELAESDVALVTLKSFERGGGFRRDGFKSYTGAFKPEQVLDEGDCVVACTDVTQRAELIGRSALVTASPAHSKLVASLDVAVIRPTQPSVSSVFLASLLASSRYVSYVLGHATGTTVLHLSRDAVPNYAFACPTPSLLDTYTSLAGAMFEQRAANVRREETLAALRDTLLPRLISGKLRLPDARQLAEADA